MIVYLKAIAIVLAFAIMWYQEYHYEHYHTLNSSKDKIVKIQKKHLDVLKKHLDKIQGCKL